MGKSPIFGSTWSARGRAKGRKSKTIFTKVVETNPDFDTLLTAMVGSEKNREEVTNADAS